MFLMGASQSVVAAASKEIDEFLVKDFERLNKVIKLLLLGPGASGKSTILKQMKILHGEGFSNDELVNWVPTIHVSVIENLAAILDAMTVLNICFDTTICEIYKQTILDFHLSKEVLTSGISQEVTIAINKLWADSGVQKCFSLSHLFQLSDNIKFFLDDIERISHPKYVPSLRDVLNLQVRTTGIVHFGFKMRNKDFSVVDVGGQRSERKKWIHCFDNVNAIIFVAALSEYDQMLSEDRKTNRLIEALVLYKSICNSNWFRETTVILFLNKRDLFVEKLKTSPLSNLFKSYKGRNNQDEALDFVKTQFRNQNKQLRKPYTHFTCATNTNQIEIVLQSCLDAIMESAVKSVGLKL